MFAWSNSQFSIARFYGGIRFNGEHYTYLPGADQLVRDDVLAWLKKNLGKPEGCDPLKANSMPLF